MALQYLLDPAFQVVNTAGKPATGGYINVFIHGTRDRYYCASDFNGTLHPFNIPLDSLGSNVVLADDSRAYDVYVYNRYGTQLYSRYNVRASAGGGISSTEIISSDGSITVTDTANGVDLSVNGVKPSVLRAGTIPRTSDGNFTFTYKEREGDDITLDQGGIKLAKGWYHFDVAVEIEWNAPAENRSVPVVITAANGAARDELDLTFSHTDSLTLCGELHNPSVNLMDFEVAASGIPTGATVRVKEVGIHTVHGAGVGGSLEQVNADWDAVSGPSEILHKPSIPSKTSDLQNDSGFITASEVPEQVNADWDATSGLSEILHKPKIPTATSELQNDSGFITLSDVPAQINADWNAVSGPSEIFNKPEIPTKTSDLDNDSGFITLSEVPAQVNSDWNAISGPEEILNKPAIPTKTSDLQNDSGFVTNAEIPEQVNADWESTSGKSEILNKPQTAPLVAGTNITITETQDGIEISAQGGGTEQVNADWDATSGPSEILNKPSIPSKTSDLQNDSGFITASQVPAQVNADWNATSGVSEILNKPSIPTATSELQNDSGFITLAEVPAQVNSDWNATSGPEEILNKPAIPSKTSDLQNDSGYITLSEVPEQVNADWNATSGAAEILNKPAIPNKTSDLQNDSGYITLAEVPAQVNADWDATSGAAEILNKPDVKPLVAGSNITITETSEGVEISAQGGGTAQVNADWDAVSGPAEILHKPTIPTNTSDLNNDSGYITASQVPAQVNADWDATSGISEILNKPDIKPIVAGSNITITESSTGVEIAATAAPQVNADWNAVSGPSEILNKPDLTLYATKAELDTKEDEFEAGTGLEFTTDGLGNRVLQVEAPVDIVAGNGIAIDNPDGNTLRITNIGVPISATEATRCGTFRGDVMYTKTYEFTGTVGTSETTINMAIDEKKGTGGVNRIWLDPSNSFVLYGSSGNNFLPLSWRLGSSRQGSVAVLGASTGSLSCRCIDTSSTPLTFNVTIRYTVSA